MTDSPAPTDVRAKLQADLEAIRDRKARIVYPWTHEQAANEYAAMLDRDRHNARDALAALAALPAPADAEAGEPVAFRWRWEIDDPGVWYFAQERPYFPSGGSVRRIVEPLYVSPKRSEAANDEHMEKFGLAIEALRECNDTLKVFINAAISRTIPPANALFAAAAVGERARTALIKEPISG